MADVNSAAHTLIGKLTDLFASLPQVKAVALGGSRSTGVADTLSDVDLYVYTHEDIPVVERQALVMCSGGASRADIGFTFWGPGDEWFDAETGTDVNVVYFDASWMEGQLHRVLHEHQASLGYSTSFCWTVRHAHIFYDPHAWLRTLQQQSHEPYPEALRHNIIALNHPVLRRVIPSYLHQLEKAVQRQDRVSVNHRVAGLLASYFDIIFALNRSFHPGEKRLIMFARRECPNLPAGMERDVQLVLQAAGTGTERLLGRINQLLDRLDDLLEQEGSDVCSS